LEKILFLKSVTHFLLRYVAYLIKKLIQKKTLLNVCIGLAAAPVGSRVARFVLVQHTKWVKIYQITIIFTKWPQEIPKGRKVD
jgi:anthranilate/para-aminobenzoate synthase component II